MDNAKQFAAHLAAAARTLLAQGYIEEATAEALADYGLEAAYASPDADEPGGASSWTDEEATAYRDALHTELLALGLP